MIHPVRLDENHRYWSGDRRVPGYSEIVKDLGVAPENKFYTDAGREEGIALHQWLHFLASGRTATSEPDPRIAGRVAGIEKFIRDTGFKFIGGEEPQYDPVVGFACTPDAWGTIGTWTWCLDAKRGAKLPTHSLQTAAQVLALARNGFRAQKRGALYLRDEDYRLVEHTDASDRGNWIALVQAWKIKQEYL